MTSAFSLQAAVAFSFSVTSLRALWARVDEGTDRSNSLVTFKKVGELLPSNLYHAS
jgi:hypothetical protein